MVRARKGAGATDGGGGGGGAMYLHGHGFPFFLRGGEGMREDKGKLKKKTWRTRISNKIMYLFMYQDRQCKWCTTY